MPVFECPIMPEGNRKKMRLLQQENERLKKELEETKENEKLFARACAVLLLHYIK